MICVSFSLICIHYHQKLDLKKSATTSGAPSMKDDQAASIGNQGISQDMFRFVNCYILIMHLDDQIC